MFDKRTNKIGELHCPTLNTTLNTNKQVSYLSHTSSDSTTTLKVRHKIVDSINLACEMQSNSVTNIIWFLSRRVFTQMLQIGTRTMQ